MKTDNQSKSLESITETAFTMDTSSIKYGPGITSEVGYEMARLGCKNVLIVTDPNLVEMPVVKISLDSLQSEGLEVSIFNQVKVHSKIDFFHTNSDVLKNRTIEFSPFP